ncbi:MAG: alpha/beta hydrolase [Actinomycetota bacterium]|nr:alpha/beta hydrolase [Actinomycetota bacterium]
MPIAEVNGQRLYFEDSGGSGPPVLFSHGFLMDHEMFHPQVEALADEFRCITWDERGFGSTPADGPFTYWDSAADAMALLDHVGVDSAVLVGMSQGGFLSLRAALAEPRRVKALGLIDTQAGVEEEGSRPAFIAMRDEWTANGPANVQDVVAGLIIGPGVDSAPWFEKWGRLDRQWLVHAHGCLMERDDITDRLGEITCPSIIFHGSDDAAIPMVGAESLRHGLGACEALVVVEGGSHAANLSHPDQVNGPLREFLRRHA